MVRFAALFANVFLAAADLSGHYMGRVRGIIKIDVTFNGDATVDATIDVIGQTKIDCSSENIAETDSLVSFPDAPSGGDCIGDGIRSDGKDPTKYTIIKNDDGTLTFTSDGYPNLKMEKQSLAAKEDLVGHYMGRVRGIIKIDVTFNGDATVDATIDVISQTKIDCSSENIAETDSLVTFLDAPTEGDCIGDGIRSDGKDPTKYTIIKNDDGTLTFTSDGYPNLKMTKQSLAAKEDLVGHYMGRVRGIIKIDVTFNGDATVEATIDVISQTKIDCSSENIAETDSLVTFPDAPTEGDCIGDGIRSDGKDPTKYTIVKNDDGTLTFTSDGYPNLKMEKQSSDILV